MTALHLSDLLELDASRGRVLLSDDTTAQMEDVRKRIENSRVIFDDHVDSILAGKRRAG